MAIALSNRRRWLLAVGLVLLAGLYLLLAGTEFAASVFASRAELPSLERAVRLAPGNADYRHRLGRYFAFVAGDPQSAIGRPRSPGPPHPPHAPRWFGLGAAY